MKVGDVVWVTSRLAVIMLIGKSPTGATRTMFRFGHEVGNKATFDYVNPVVGPQPYLPSDQFKSVEEAIDFVAIRNRLSESKT